MIKSNILYSMLTNVGRLVFGLITFALLSRVLGLSVFGQYIFVITAVGYLSILIDYGFNLSTLNEVPKNTKKIKNLFYEIVITKGFLTALSYFILLAYLLISDQLGLILIFSLFMAVVVLQSFSGFLSHIFKAVNRFDVDFYLVISNNILVLLLIFIFKENLNLLEVAWIYLFSRLVGTACQYLYFNYAFRGVNLVGKVRINFKRLKSNFKYAAHAVIGGVFLSVDILIMKEVLTLKDVAIYSAGIKLFVAIVLVGDILCSSYMPKLSQCANKNSEIFDSRTCQLMLLMLGLGAFFSVTIFFLGEFVIMIVFGEKFAALTALLPYFSLALFLRFLSIFYGTIVTIAGKQSMRALMITIVFVLHVVLNIWLQKLIGINGAIISFCISFGVLTLGNMAIVFKCYGRLFFLKL